MRRDALEQGGQGDVDVEARSRLRLGVTLSRELDSRKLGDEDAVAAQPGPSAPRELSASSMPLWRSFPAAVTPLYA